MRLNIGAFDMDQFTTEIAAKLLLGLIPMHYIKDNIICLPIITKKILEHDDQLNIHT